MIAEGPCGTVLIEDALRMATVESVFAAVQQLCVLYKEAFHWDLTEVLVAGNHARELCGSLRAAGGAHIHTLDREADALPEEEWNRMRAVGLLQYAAQQEMHLLNVYDLQQPNQSVDSDNSVDHERITIIDLEESQ